MGGPFEAAGIRRGDPAIGRGAAGLCVYRIPAVQFDTRPGSPNAAEMHGVIRQTDEAEIGAICLFRDPLLTDVTVPARSRSSGEPDRLGWAFRSVGVFYRDQAIGMVIEASSASGGSAVRLMAFDQIVTRASANAHAAQLLAELGLSPNRPLVVVSPGPELVETGAPVAPGQSGIQ